MTHAKVYPAREVRCRRCFAEEGEVCRSPAGKVTGTHSVRMSDYVLNRVAPRVAAQEATKPVLRPADILSIACPRCHAVPGDTCVSSNDVLMRKSHMARVRAYKKSL